MTPRAIWSLPQKIASGISPSNAQIRATASRPQDSDHSPKRTTAFSPATARKALERSRTEKKSSGPVICAILQRPCSISHSTASVAPWESSERKETLPGPPSVKAYTTGTGTLERSIGRLRSTRLPVAIIPSTCLSSIASTWICPSTGLSSMAHRKTDTPRSTRASETPAMTGNVKRPYVSFVRRPIVKLRLESRPCAKAFGRNPISRATFFTRWRVSSPIRPVLLSAFDAVEILTPAIAAKSRIVCRPPLLPIRLNLHVVIEKTFYQIYCQLRKRFLITFLNLRLTRGLTISLENCLNGSVTSNIAARLRA